MATPPPSKAELDRINKELEKMRQPKAPAPRLVPGGSMAPMRDQVDQVVLREAIKQREERARVIQEQLAKSKNKARDHFNER